MKFKEVPREQYRCHYCTDNVPADEDHKYTRNDPVLGEIEDYAHPSCREEAEDDLAEMPSSGLGINIVPRFYRALEEHKGDTIHKRIALEILVDTLQKAPQKRLPIFNNTEVSYGLYVENPDGPSDYRKKFVKKEGKKMHDMEKFLLGGEFQNRYGLSENPDAHHQGPRVFSRVFEDQKTKEEYGVLSLAYFNNNRGGYAANFHNEFVVVGKTDDHTMGKILMNPEMLVDTHNELFPEWSKWVEQLDPYYPKVERIKNKGIIRKDDPPLLPHMFDEKSWLKRVWDAIWH